MPRSIARDLALACLVCLASACTARPVDEVEESVPLGPPRAADDLVAPAGPGPEIVLITDSGSAVAGSSTTITVYGDGRVMREKSVGMGETLPPGTAWMFAQADERTVARLRDLVARQDVLEARSAYHEPGLHDGGGTMVIAGPQPRRIMVLNDPPDLPPGLADLVAESRALDDMIDRHGVDAFTGPRPVLLSSGRSFAKQRHADELIVFADGTLEYRITYGDAAVEPDRDYPYPIVHTRSLDRAGLRPLLAAVQALRKAGLPETRLHRGAPKNGTRNSLRARDLARQVYISGDEVPPEVERVLVEVRWLRASFDAPPDEPPT